IAGSIYVKHSTGTPGAIQPTPEVSMVEARVTTVRLFRSCRAELLSRDRRQRGLRCRSRSTSTGKHHGKEKLRNNLVVRLGNHHFYKVIKMVDEKYLGTNDAAPPPKGFFILPHRMTGPFVFPVSARTQMRILTGPIYVQPLSVRDNPTAI